LSPSKRRPRSKAKPAKKPAAADGDATYRVAKLKAGTVIDRLEAGTALKCLSILGIPEESVVTIGLNLPSKRLGRKDILKVENRELSVEELARLSLFGPRAVVSIIEDYRIVRKIPLELPEVLDRVLSCPNPSCITHHDPVPSRVRVEKQRPLRLRCHYCERRIRAEEIELL
jgi:aspartate carbamoyltransferase regulatory subunit